MNCLFDSYRARYVELSTSYNLQHLTILQPEFRNRLKQLKHKSLGCSELGETHDKNIGVLIDSEHYTL